MFGDVSLDPQTHTFWGDFGLIGGRNNDPHKVWLGILEDYSDVHGS